MAEICSTCGLPEELCVCEDVSKDEVTLEIKTEERSYNKTVTLVIGLPDDVDKSSLASKLKSQLACGGTINDSGNIELQGQHLNRIGPILEDEGYEIDIGE